MIDSQDSWYKLQKEYYRVEAQEQEKNSPYFNLLFTFFNRILNARQDDIILEFGCNEGRYTIPLLKMGYKITALDISQESLCSLMEKAAKEGVGNNLKIVEGKIEEYKGQSFDVIFCADVLHHVYDLNLVASRLYSLLNEKGRIVCLEPNPLNILWYIHILMVGFKKSNKWKIERRITKCTEKNLKRVFYKNGFKKVKIYPFLFFPPQIINRLSLLKKLEPALAKTLLINKFLCFNIIEAFK